MNLHALYRFDDFVVDPETWRLSRGGQEIHLEPVVLNLLFYLISHRDRLVTRRELMDTVWGDTVISESAVNQAVARLRKALGDDSATHRYLETVHSRGYRFIAEVQETNSPDYADRAPAEPRKTAGRRVLFAGAAMVMLALAVFWARAPEPDTPQHEQIRTLAVLPLSNLTGEPELDYYVDGMQDLLITELSQLPTLRVTSRQSTKRYRGSQLPATDIAKELGVDALVEGSLLGKGNKLEVTIQLIDGRSDKHLWAERYSRDTSYVFDLVSDMARAIGTEIVSMTAPPGPQIPDHGLKGPVDPRAIEAYASGLIHLDRFTSDGILFAIERFQEAVNIEPKFALAWGQLAIAYAMQGLQGFAPPRESIERSRAAALQAIEADDQVAIGHSVLGWGRMWSGDLEGACESIKKALRFNPSAPYAMHGDADCLMFAGRFDESVSRTREVSALGPFSAMHNRPLVFHLFLARRYDEAIAAASAAQVRAPGFSMHAILARVYWAQGDRDKALEAERRELEYRRDTVLLAVLEQGLDAAGPHGAMQAMAEALVERAQTAYVDPFLIGETFARAGAVDEALLWLEKAAEYGSFETTYIAFRPDFDVLREDPRYLDLAGRIYGLGSPISNRP